MTTTTERDKLASNLDGARFVHYAPEIGAVFAWFGGHGINVFEPYTGDEVHFFNVGDFAEDAATLDEVREGIEDQVRETLEHR